MLHQLPTIDINDFVFDLDKFVDGIFGDSDNELIKQKVSFIF